MKRALISILISLAFLAGSGAGQAATVTIDFDSPLVPTGEYNPSDTVVTVSGLTVSIAQGTQGNPRNGGTVQQPGSSIGGNFSGNYLSTSGGGNDRRVDLAFSIPIIGMVTVDVNYPSASAGTDLQIIEMVIDAPNTVVYSADDGAQNTQISFNLATPVDVLRFRTVGAGNTVEIDNLVVNTIPVPASVWLFGSALGLLGWLRRKTN